MNICKIYQPWWRYKALRVNKFTILGKKTNNKVLFRLEPLKLQPVTTEWHCRDNFMAKMQIKMIYKQAVHS